MSLTLPQKLANGSQVWLDPEVMEAARIISAYDDRLSIVKNQDQSWSIYRVAEDGQEAVVARSKPHAKLDPHFIVKKLQDGDTRRRGNDVVERVIKQNEKRERDMDSKYEDNVNDAMDKLMSKAWKGRIPSNIEDVNI